YLAADPPCLEYEFVSGGDLSRIILDWQREQPPDLWLRATRTMLELSRIIAFAHRLTPPIVHRDLKPANVLVQRDEEGHTRRRALAEKTARDGDEPGPHRPAQRLRRGRPRRSPGARRHGRGPSGAVARAGRRVVGPDDHSAAPSAPTPSRAPATGDRGRRGG